MLIHSIATDRTMLPLQLPGRDVTFHIMLKFLEK